MKIAIQGHSARGHKVIQILENLGGKNTTELNGRAKAFYHIDKGEIRNDYYPPTNYKLYTLEEFEKEFPFKIGDKVTIIGLSDFPKVITQMVWDCDEVLYSFEGLNNTWFGAKSLKKFEMNEERNITLTLDKAKEWYNKGGELKEVALQAFSEKELNPLPKSWEEYCKMYKVPTNIFGPCAPIKHIALWKLERLRDCYRQGWEPDWTSDYTDKYCIVINKNKLTITSLLTLSTFLAFQSREVAEEFLKNFKSLIKEAGDLI